MLRDAMQTLNTVTKMFMPAKEEKISRSKTDTISILNEALRNIYIVFPQSYYEYIKNNSYSLAGYKPPEPSMQQREAECEALSALQNLHPNFSKSMLSLILEAHILLGAGCFEDKPQYIKQAIKLLNQTPLFPEQKKAFLETRFIGSQTDEDFWILGFLGYASRHNYLEVVAELLANGANPGCKPLREEKTDNYDDKPIFFSATNPIAWIDFRTSTQSSIPINVVPFDISMKHIKHYLTHNFDINTLYKKQNVLQHAYTANLSGDMHYHVHLLAHSILNLYNQEKISDNDYETFCATLHDSNLLKLFPILAIPYEKVLALNTHAKEPKLQPIYRDGDELNYYLLRSLLFNLIGLCAYERDRINSDYITIFTKFVPMFKSKKSSNLSKSLNELNQLQSDFCEGEYGANNVKHQKFSKELNEQKNKITKIVSEQRFFVFGKTVSSTEWNCFLMMNAPEVEALKYQFATLQMNQSKRPGK